MLLSPTVLFDQEIKDSFSIKLLNAFQEIESCPVRMVGLDVMGEGYENLSAGTREEIITAFPRTDFKKKIIPTFFSGFEHKPETTFGNIKADVCAFMLPNFHRKNFYDCILHSPWSE